MFDVGLRLVAPALPPSATDGSVELCGRLAAPGGWLVSGWTNCRWDDGRGVCVRLHFPTASITAAATTCFYERDDLITGAVGFLLMLHHPGPVAGWLVEMTVETTGAPAQRLPAAAGLPIPEDLLRNAARRLLRRIAAPPARAALQGWLAPHGLADAGRDADEQDTVRLQLEEVMHTRPAGLVLIGWLDDPAERIAALEIACGDRVRAFDSTTWVRLPRRDVQIEMHRTAEEHTVDRGFLAYFPDIRVPGAPIHVRITYSDGTRARHAVPQPRSTGLVAMQRVLGAFHLRGAALSRAMDQVIGPAVSALHENRLRQPAATQDLCFGPPPAPPRCTVIVHLSARENALEWHLALLSERPDPDIEYLFVLDDPIVRDAVQYRAQTCLARFGLPFRLLVVDRFLGQAPCLNLAAARAGGPVLCFLGADAVPTDAAWLERLIASLERAPGIGAAGARLPHASHTPARPGAGATVEVATLSADCLAIRRAAFDSVGGFEEAYAVTGFADEDLCHKLRRSGWRCVERRDVALALLPRPGEALALWRRNLALYNAWQRDRRWPAAC
jgi:hypothetical protein